MSIYTVPAGKIAAITSASSDSSSGKSVVGSFFVRPFGQVFQLKYRYNLFENSRSLNFKIPYLIDEKSDLDIRAISSAAGTRVTASWQMEIISK